MSVPTESSRKEGRVLRAVSMNVAAAAIGQGVNLLRVMLTARLLRPEDFGLFGIAMVVYGAFIAFSEFNLRLAFIAQQFKSGEEERDWRDTVWTADVLIKAMLGVAMIAAAYPAALYFREPGVTGMIMLISLSPVIRALESPALLTSEKRIQFRGIAFYHVATDITGAVVTAAAALLLQSAWALAISHVVSAVIATMIAYAVAPCRPRFRLVREPLRAAFNFGKPLIAASVLHFAAGRFDNLVVARQLGAQVLGAYVAAIRLIEMPVALVSYEIGRVLLPYYVESARRSPEALSEAFVRSARYLCWGALAIYIPLAAYADLAVWLILGEGWEAAVLPVRILAISGVLRTGGRAIGTLLKAMQVPGLDARAMAVEVAALVVAALVTVPLAGITGAAWSVVVSFAAGLAFRLFALRTRFSMTWQHAATVLARPIAGATIASLVAAVVQTATDIELLGLVTFVLALLGAGWSLEPEVRILVTQRLTAS